MAASPASIRRKHITSQSKNQRIAELEAELAELKRYLHKWNVPFPNDGIDRRLGVPGNRRTPSYGGPLTTIRVPADPRWRP